MKRTTSGIKEHFVGLIKESGLSLAKIEKMSGISEHSMNNWLYGKAMPSLDKAILILKAIGYEIVIKKQEEGQ